MTTRRNFIKTAGIGAAGLTIAANSYGRILGSNNKIRVGLVGFADRAKGALLPAFLQNAKELNFELVAVSDIWSRRRDEAKEWFAKQGYDIALARNNEELYEKMNVDAVIIATADFQHALHTIEAVRAGKDVYIEKPFAETMEDNRAARKAVQETGLIVQVGSQRRSGQNYQAAAEYIKSGKFGKINMVEMTWNVNQPGRWRRPDLIGSIKESDTDWKRFIMNRPYVDWNPRYYLEYRLFWPFSSGIPGQWMSHQIDTVHWFSGYTHPRSVTANGGLYMWQDGRTNYDTMSAVFDYGPKDNMKEGFQVLYSSRMHNSAGGTKELYFSNGGTLNLDTNMVTSNGGLEQRAASVMGLQANLLSEFTLASEKEKVATSANTGSDPMTTAHIRNWMECIRSRKEPNAGINAAYNHSVANIMCTAALHTGERVIFDETTQQVIAGGKPFLY